MKEYCLALKIDGQIYRVWGRSGELKPLAKALMKPRSTVEGALVVPALRGTPTYIRGSISGDEI
jgi:hypothetical protein